MFSQILFDTTFVNNDPPPNGFIIYMWLQKTRPLILYNTLSHVCYYFAKLKFSGKIVTNIAKKIKQTLKLPEYQRHTIIIHKKHRIPPFFPNSPTTKPSPQKNPPAKPQTLIPTNILQVSTKTSPQH